MSLSLLLSNHFNFAKKIKLLFENSYHDLGLIVTKAIVFDGFAKLDQFI